jgi:hypothetical protein
MNNEPTRRRPPLLRGAMDGACAAWTPILPTGKEAVSGKAAAATEPTVSEADRTPASASDAEP